MTNRENEPGRHWREEYISRINRVVDYIEANLGERLSLEGLAKVANFSPFHFHRIFGAMVGETLNHFIARLRTEKAAMQLAANPKKSITEIALDCGFSSSATFARAFKDRFSMSATEWRELRCPGYSQDRQTGSQRRQNEQQDRRSGRRSLHIRCCVNCSPTVEGQNERDQVTRRRSERATRAQRGVCTTRRTLCW